MDYTELFKKYTKDAVYLARMYNKAITILGLIAVIYFAHGQHKMADAVNKNTAATIKQSQYVIKVNNANQIRGFERELLTDVTYKFAIAKIIEDYLVLSAIDLTQGTGRREFHDFKALYNAQKGVGGLKEFDLNFIQTKTSDENLQALSFKGRESLANALKKINLLLTERQIPLSIDSQRIQAKDIAFRTKGSGFEIDVDIYHHIAGVIADGSASYKNIRAKSVFKLKGYIDAEQSHPVLNPLGVKFYDILMLPALSPKAGKTKQVRNQN